MNVHSQIVEGEKRASASSRIYDWLVQQPIGLKFSAKDLRKAFPTFSNGSISGCLSRFSKLSLIKPVAKINSSKIVVYNVVDPSVKIRVDKTTKGGGKAGRVMMNRVPQTILPREYTEDYVAVPPKKRLLPIKPAFDKAKEEELEKISRVDPVDDYPNEAEETVVVPEQPKSLSKTRALQLELLNIAVAITQTDLQDRLFNVALELSELSDVTTFPDEHLVDDIQRRILSGVFWLNVVKG